ncbi:MAG: hypothetical protein JW761_05395, partial [Prolixibacteraceae bacterium]|nr:hypothetical protein [Prolixibacteraceae bacterium]
FFDSEKSKQYAPQTVNYSGNPCFLWVNISEKYKQGAIFKRQNSFTMLQRFKEKWDIKSNFQLFVILFVFSVTGSAALVVRKMVFHMVGIQPDTSLLIKVPLYILVLVPSYQFLLLVIGSLLGQYRFFLAYEKKTVGRLIRRNKKLHEEN